MARVAVVTGGYRGDVLPFVPLARELASRGHEVRLLVPSEFHPLLVEEPFDVPPSFGDDLGPAFLEQYAAFMGRWGRRLGGSRVALLMLKLVSERLEEIVQALEPHAEWAELAVVHPIAGLSVAMPFERRGVPHVVGDLFPMLLPSAASPAYGARSLGPFLNRLSWQIGRSRVSDPVSFARPFRRMRARLGLPTDDWNLVDARSSPHLNVGLVSRHYVDPQPDWPQPYHLCGFTFWDTPPGYRLPDDVRVFLDSGPAPVLVCLGTSAASAQRGLFARIERALDKLGRRGLFLTSTAENASELTTDRGHGAWPFVPLAAVLDRCSAVVHSGAHGTNALTLRSGLPSVVVPCLQDQLWHAHRQEQLGTGVSATPDAIEHALSAVLTNTLMHERAQRLGEAIGTENGPATASDHIDDLLRT